MKKGILLLIACLFALQASAQFVNYGRGGGDLRYKQLKTNQYKIVYPDYYEVNAIRLSGYMDSMMSGIRYGMRRKIQPVPIVLETQNQLSNGMVVWAPKREELVTTAPPNTYALSWMRQLSVHEFRHATQISNMKGGLTKVATWVLGEAGMSLGMLFMSRWKFEGDAVNAETQLAEYGRGMQPELSIGYRAMMHDGIFWKNSADKLIAGSFKDHIPSYYNYGYLVARATETYTRPDIWGKLFEYAGNWPLFLFPDAVYLSHHYKTGLGKIAKRGFGELEQLWKPISAEPNSFELITKPSRSYTTYSTPIGIEDGSILAHKVDFDTPKWLIQIDTNGVEKRLIQQGNVSSRMNHKNGVVYWTEYLSDLIYEKKNSSVIRSYNIKTKKTKFYCKGESNYFVTALDNGFATVKNDSLSNGYIQFYDNNFKKLTQHHFTVPTTLHGLAWDDLTSTLSFIALNDSGMWIGSLQDGSVKVLRAPNVVSVSELRARDGQLYYGSIESGKDEIHSLDINSGVEVRLTQSKFGSSQGSSDGKNLYLAGYTSKGYMIGKQQLSNSIKDTVEWSRLPQNRVNYDWVKWEIDKPKFDSMPMDADTTKHKIKRFSRFGHFFNFHSWVPLAIDLSGERNNSINLGGTGFFQSTLGDMYGSLSLGALNNSFWGLADFVYAQFPVKIGVRAEYGGGSQLAYGYSSGMGAVENVKDYFSIRASLTAPMNFSSGSTYRSLNPSFSVTHYNALMFGNSVKDVRQGLQMWNASLSWNVSKASAYRALKPRLGYSLLAGISGAFNDQFGVQYTTLARGYLPGIAPNHSITLNASYQWQDGDNKYRFTSKTLRVRGVNDNASAENYAAATIDYVLPVFYPDFGIPYVMQFKRVWLNLFADYSIGNYHQAGLNRNIIFENNATSHHSIGFDLGIDFALIRSFEQTIKFSFAFPNDRAMFFAIGFNLGF